MTGIFEPQADKLYTTGSNLEVPGLEAILEYGDASKFKNGRIPGSMLINDHSRLDMVRLTQLDGLHDDPEGGDTRQPNADRHGERAGQMLYRGRTLGLTGRVEAGNLGAMRNNWRRFRGQFGITERDLIVHHPFEEQTLVNQVREPSQIGTTWSVSSSSGTTSVSVPGVTDGAAIVGSVTATSTTGSGALSIWEGLPNLDDLSTIRWPGGDVWITARVKVFSATTTVASLQLGLQQYYNVNEDTLANSTTGAAAVATQTSPATGTWYTLSTRVPVSSIVALNAGVTHVTPRLWLNYSGAGTFVLHFHQVAMIFVDPADPTPPAYFDGDTPGFSWDGDPHFSTSSGPYWSENRVPDPRFESYDAITKLLSSYSYYATNLTAIQAPIRVESWKGDHVQASVYHHAQHDASTTSAAMGLRIQDSSQLSNLIHVHEARRYRFSAKVNLVTKPTGNVVASITWFNAAGATISTISSEVLVIGENDASISATAPVGAYGAQLNIWNAAVTQANGVLDVYASDICFVDITDVDPGNFYGVGDGAEEIGNRRRITRPFLLQGVRKTSDMKSPEQQSRNRAWRDFTMSLRASDPRIYVLDERSEWLQMTGNPQLVFENMYELVLPSGAITTAPSGFTIEGQTGATGWQWGTQSLFDSRPMMSVGNATNASDPTGPAATAIQRAYRSAEGYTYTHPRVIIHGHFQMAWASGAYPAFDRNNTTNVTSWNGVGILLKRVSSSQWLELRVNASSHIFNLNTYGYTDSPYTAELWSSHNASGTAAVTRLAQWDVANTISLSDPSRYPLIIQAEIDAGQNVNVDITGTSNAGGTLRSLSKTYALPAALQTLFGTSVAGHCGEWMRSDNWDDTALWEFAGSVGFPWISYFESSNSNVVPSQMSCAVIGDIETPQKITLRGDITGPILQLNSTDEDGAQISSTMRLTGVAEEINPVIIDVADRTIKDSNGINRYSMFSSGSLHPLMPGANDLIVTAQNWVASPQHVQVAWRDAFS